MNPRIVNAHVSYPQLTDEEMRKLAESPYRSRLTRSLARELVLVRSAAKIDAQRRESTAMKQLQLTEHGVVLRHLIEQVDAIGRNENDPLWTARPDAALDLNGVRAGFQASEMHLKFVRFLDSARELLRNLPSAK